MLGIGWRLLVLALGGLAGYGLAYGLTLNDLASFLTSEPEVAETAAAVHAEPPEPVQSEPVQSSAHPGECEPLAGPHADGPDATGPDATTGSLVRRESAGNALPRWTSSKDPQTPAEWYQAFASEVRDPALAGPAEDRIAELIAETATPGLRTEYLRCAARFCAIAGYVTSSNPFDSCVIGGWIGGAAVFRGNLRYSCIDQEYDGGRRFIVFVDSAPAS